MLQCVGDKPCHFILIFDKGYFSEVGTFSVTDLIGHAPTPVPAKNLGLPAEAFAKFPKGEVYFARGERPQAEPTQSPAGSLTPSPETHRFPMLAEEPYSVHRGGREWRVGSDKFRISATVTGVILELVPGGLRELHWHPNADEWQYVIEGDNIDVTMFGSHGRFRIEPLSKGYVGYIPQGYGHSIDNKGKSKMRMLLGFNSGTYQAIDLSAGLASNPDDVLRTNFGMPDEVIKQFPKKRVFIASKDDPTGNEPGSKIR